MYKQSGGGLVDRIRMLFRDRELIIRDGEGYRRRVLTGRTQWVRFGLIAGLTVWGVASAAILWQARSTTADQASHLAALQIGYAGIIADLAREAPTAEGDDAWRATYLRERQALQAVIAALEADLDQANGRLARQEQSLDASERARRATSQQLVRFLDSLNTLRVERDELRDEVDRLQTEIAALSTTRETLVEQRSRLNGQVADLRVLLEDSASWSSTLEGQVENLASAVDGAYGTVDRLAAERDDLRHQLEEDRRELAAATVEIDQLEGRLQWANRQLAVLETDRAALIDERGALRGLVVRLEEDLRETVEGHEALLARLVDETADHIEAVEEGLSRTGLDVDALIQSVRSEQTQMGLGGPLVPVVPDRLLDEEARIATQDLNRAIARAGDLQSVIDRLPIHLPVEGARRTSGFGGRRDPITGQVARHEGLDFSAPMRTPVRAAAQGSVIHAGWRGGYGNLVEVDHGLGLTTRYAHLHRIDVEDGQEVAAGDTVGLVGVTGRTTGPHLHYEVRFNGAALNPAGFIGAGEDVLQVATAQEPAIDVTCAEDCAE